MHSDQVRQPLQTAMGRETLRSPLRGAPACSLGRASLHAQARRKQFLEPLQHEKSHRQRNGSVEDEAFVLCSPLILLPAVGEAVSLMAHLRLLFFLVAAGWEDELHLQAGCLLEQFTQGGVVQKILEGDAVLFWLG